MKRILITGATSGIGKQLAIDYAKLGNEVIACGRNQKALDELVEIGAGRISACQLDVSNAEQTRAALADKTGLDIVILSAGVCEYLDVEQFEAALFERVFEVNIFGAMRCVEAVLPNLAAGSHLVLVGSTARLLPFTRAQAYGGSKAALSYIANSLQVDLAERGIRVQTVSPGFVETPMTDANDFEMPMRVTVDDASKAIRRGIEKNRTDIAFPRVFATVLKLLSLLPQRVQVAISKRIA
ncbi:SDR family NAD(P)-dependent oxidoreductase [Pseudidiomarina taiwanensis]|uniref:Short-chain dehydrogenase n=1 Tax=Pseudidiomarina taiwanensis TaxID=337250 RepID=A0A432ZN16_9GAMM|nr:SDR family NAD(P)-dependent oxidoreductase [Pseudidiomarina taiwanensis]RUO79252.1 short-chain dehydrogenase [Pseudidiomarina taiwanensis]